MKIRQAIWVRSASAIACAGLLAVAAGAAVQAGQEKKRPSITVRASPSAGFSPLKVFLTAEIKGGDDDFADFYCPTIEWVWGDDTRAESTADCDPYEPKKSEIRRRYSVTRVFQNAGNFKVEFRLKQKDKVVGSGSINLQVRPGVRDGGGS
ncbi:MAG TPA: hypothetical protein VJ813_13350 [Vicinamibacterales bacterium]|nr:hypothetical protein [Vicinamibacterales bacterium]